MFINKLAEHIRYRTILEHVLIVPEYDFMHLVWQETPYQAVIERRDSAGYFAFRASLSGGQGFGRNQAQALALFEEVKPAAGSHF